ncbi:hypothetical protein [Streptomyces sp. V2I9]|uniref:hypothetical protein n=1 Tax=Streptomyces sp. V2I9 TaxID=3042304 RepID=UPI00278A74CF|nr:hypothetical protein [Streptomyces sp. V2I9]MDQ0984588.1 hypothetical protein [Streptomyces sp. V2I9]
MFDKAAGPAGPEGSGAPAGSRAAPGPGRSGTAAGRSAAALRERRLLVRLLVLPLLTGLVPLLAVPGTAHAAGGCSGRPAKTVAFSTGELRVYKSRGLACAVTVAKKPGKRRTMSVTLQARGGHAVTDKGAYTKMAGPVTVSALNRCVRASGAIGKKSASTGWILC